MTELERAAANALRDLDAALDRVFELGPLAIAVIDRQHRFRRVNRRLCDLLGYGESELLRRRLSDVVHPDDQPVNEAFADRTFASDIPHFTLETRYRTRYGATVWVSVTGTPVSDDSGAPIFGLAMIEDISERKSAEQQIRDLNHQLERRIAELERLNKELEAFSATVSHDLKGPLVSIGQFSQLLLSDPEALGERPRELVQRIRAAGVQAKRIIDDLRALADVTRREIFSEEVDLSELANSVIDDLRALAPQREVSFLARPDLRAYGDPTLLRLLLTNLLQNAWKYSATRECARIELGMQPGPLRDVFFVRDNGIGFDPAYSERIFEAFERLHTEAEYTGTGLGLATARRIVRRHGGDIWAEGSPGEGATLYFTL